MNKVIKAKDIIVSCVFDDDTGMMISMTGINNPRELICCKDCKYWPYKSMPYASDEKYTEHYPQCFDAKPNGYCYLAEREEECI